MKCPYCEKEIRDEASFCGFCGRKIAAPPTAETPAPVVEMPAPAVQPAVTPTAQPQKKEKKKRTGWIVLTVFLVLALLAGAVLGYLLARNLITLPTLPWEEDFQWTDYEDGVTVPTQPAEGTSKGEEGTPEEKDPTEPSETPTEPTFPTTVPTEPTTAPTEPSVEDPTEPSDGEEIPFDELIDAVQ